MERKMPRRMDFGQHMASCIDQPIHEWGSSKYLTGGPSVMGYNLPVWQRPFVWSKDQSVSLIENIWLGFDIGTYTFNRRYDDPAYDNLLIDGQQRLKSIQDYLTGKFPVFGYLWSEVCRSEQRDFKRRHFHCYITSSKDDEYLRNYYNMVNFSGVAHTEDQRA